MSKRTAIIDIGSNSARLVIFEATSRYGFHLICEQKSKVRIGEGAYTKEGYLQPIGIKRAYLTLRSFVQTIEKYQAKEIHCVATSALRDAPNASLFLAWIKEELQLDIQVITGQKEAYYGATAAVNLLPITEGISIDIGGGSSDIALIQDRKIIDTYSLNIGTVRLKELFFEQEQSLEQINNEAKIYIQEALQALPSHFKHTLAIGIGGTARTLSKAIMKRIDYPLDKLHAFEYSLEAHLDFLEAIPQSSAKNLKQFSLKKNRYDTIREGTLIFREILLYIGAKNVIASEVGVREGVFLEQFINPKIQHFPLDKNPSIHSLLDRFKPIIKIEKKRKSKLNIATALYETLQSDIGDQQKYLKELLWALRLSGIGKTLTIYKTHKHAFYIAQQELNYAITHQENILVSLLLRMHGNELINETLYTQYASLLPNEETLRWLSFVYTLSVFLHENSNDADIRFEYTQKVLTIFSDTPLYLAKEKIKALEKPIAFAIIIEDENRLPSNKALGI